MSDKKIIREQIIDLVRKYHQADRESWAAFHAGETVVRYAGRVFDEAEMVNLVDSSLDFWLTAGRYNEEFESRLAEFLDVENVLTVNSGSSANLTAFTALTSPKLKDRAVKPGDEVITVAAGFPTTVNPIIQNRAVPVVVDVELGSYVPTLASIERALSSNTKAVMIAHTMGVPFPVAEVRELCDRRGLWLIEDNCDALGSRYDGKLTATFGDLATFSFYPAHHITMGEGGAVVTKNEDLARIARSVRDWGRDCYCTGGENNTCGKRFSQQFGTLPFGYDHKYVYSEFGFNLKVSDMQAAVGVAQLEKMPAFVEARRANYRTLTDALAPVADALVLPVPTEGADPSWFGFLMTVREGAGVTRDEIVGALERAKVQTRMLFAGNMLRQPVFTEMRESGEGYRLIGELTNTDRIMNDAFWIGVYPGMTLEMLEYMAQVIVGAVRSAG